MNVAVRNVFEKICADPNLIREFSQLSGDQIYNYLKEHSDSDFTKQDLENGIIEVFSTLYGGELSSEELDAVSGGIGSFMRKSMAMAAAALTLTGTGVPLASGNLDIAPSRASALHVPFLGHSHYKVRSPMEFDDVRESLRNDPYYSQRLRKSGADTSNPQAFKIWWNTNGKGWWEKKDPSIATVAKAKGKVENTASAARAAGTLGGKSGAVSGDASQILNFLGNAISDVKGAVEKSGVLDAGNGGGNITGDHAPEEKAASIVDIFDPKGGASEAVGVADELSAVDRLLLTYFDCVAKENGISTTSGLTGGVDSLIRDDLFMKMVKDNFGFFDVVEQPTGPFGVPTGGAVRKKVQGDARLMSLIIKRGAEQRNFDREVFLAKMQRNAPALITSLLFFSRMGTVTKVKDLLVQAGVWTKAGVMKAYNQLVYNRLTLEKDPVKLKELMTEYLKTSVFRQDKAMDRIAEIMSGMTDLWKASDDSGKPCNCACTMTFMGDSGVGKTYAARTLSKAIFHKDMQPWQFITSTSVTASSTSSTDNKTSENLSPADQLFNANSEIVRQLRLNNRVIIVLDEIDKMHKSDPNDTILERLRDARDTGKLLVRNGVNYEYIDVSRTVFICITNEFRQCWGLPEEKLSDAQAAARTTVERDKSLVNRFDIVEFNYLKAEDYAYILRPQLDELKEEYSKQHGIDINITEELVEGIAKASEIKNKGVRGVNDFLVLLRGKLVDYRSKHKKDNKSKIIIKDKIDVKYVADTGNFDIMESAT